MRKMLAYFDLITNCIKDVAGSYKNYEIFLDVINVWSLSISSKKKKKKERKRKKDPKGKYFGVFSSRYS